MTIAWLKAVPLAFLLLLPAASPSGAQNPPPGDKSSPQSDKEIIVDGEQVIALDDDEPLVIRPGHHARRVYLGVHLIDIPPDLRAHYGAPRDAGVLVGEVEPDSPASKAGIQVGDVITKVDGDKVESSSELSRSIRRKKTGDAVKIEVERNKASKSLTATVQERKGRDLDIGDLHRRLRDREWMPHDFAFDLQKPLMHLPESLDRLQEKLEDLDKRLRDLEKKLR